MPACRRTEEATVPDADRIEELRTAERQLQAAQLACKSDDLRMHGTGEQKITRVEEEDLSVLVARDTGITCFLGTLEGTLSGTQFTARIRYTRTWIHDISGWRLLAVHVSDAG
ncbi:MAG: nuclear transport factor 2 family protein [Actinobacteria bacterium]|nr:MAG: nuclear transport factor 2 family protein [Actinomycetota bacterium]